MERAHVRAWPALRTANIDGWLWRSSGGGSQRANSVSTIDFTGHTPEAALREAEARYQALGAAPRFQTFDETSPPELPELLRRHGYQDAEPTITMFKRPGQARLGNATTSPDVERHDHAWTDWRQVYLAEITGNRRQINTLILDRIPAPRAFFGVRRDGRLIATALCVVGFGCAVIECVATRADSRRGGAGRAVLTALEGWATQQDADLIGLQVVASNAPAIALYRGMGFVTGARNTFWTQPQAAD